MEKRAEEYEQLSLSLPGMNYEADKVQHTRSTEAPFVKWLLKLGDLEREIEDEKKNLDAILIEVTSAIETVGTEDHKTLLIYRYVEDMLWEDIMSKMAISKPTALKWHKLALEAMRVPVK